MQFYSVAEAVKTAFDVACSNLNLSFLVVEREESEFVNSAYKDFVSKCFYNESLQKFKNQLSESFQTEFKDFYQLFDSSEVVPFKLFTASFKSIVDRFANLDIGCEQESRILNVGLGNLEISILNVTFNILNLEQRLRLMKNIKGKLTLERTRTDTASISDLNLSRIEQALVTQVEHLLTNEQLKKFIKIIAGKFTN